MFLNCLEPKIFVNRALPQLLTTYRNYFFGNKYQCWSLGDDVIWNKSLLKRFRDNLRNVTLSNIDDYYVVDDNGYRYPIYMASKCNHCILCTESAHNTYAARLLAEAQLYNFRPWFVTLTYNDAHLPSDGVSVRDCQLFLKRFRQSLIRDFHTHEKIRYFLCSEYGQDDKYTHRPHYHAIFFNIPCRSQSEVWQVRQMMRSSWQNGNIQVRQIDMRKPSEFWYTSKYLYKEQLVPDGKNKPFSLSSRRHGGLGSAFFRQFRQFQLDNCQLEIQYADKFSGTLRTIPLSHYSLKYMLPTFNESVPLKWRKAAHFFNSLYTAYSHIDEIRMFYGDFHLKLVSLVSPYMTLEPSLHKTKYPNLKYAHYALSSLRDEMVGFLQTSNFQNLKMIEYVRKDLLNKLVASVEPLSPKELQHKANLLSANRNFKQQKKQLHYV